MRLKRVNRSKSRLSYHIVLTTKYRRNVFDSVDLELARRSLQSAVSRCSGAKLRAAGVDKNHVHLLVSAKPSWSPAALVGRIKQLSTDYLWRQEPEELAYFYNKRILWSSGYFCESVGGAESNVVAYIKGQGATSHPRKEGGL